MHTTYPISQSSSNVISGPVIGAELALKRYPLQDYSIIQAIPLQEMGNAETSFMTVPFYEFYMGPKTLTSNSEKCSKCVSGCGWLSSSLGGIYEIY